MDNRMPREGDTPSPDLAGRLHGFRSLGGNCEFGFVQRYGGVEPSGLLRFASTPLADLIRGLETDFAAYGAADDLRIEVSAGGTYYCRSRNLNIWSNTAHDVGTIDPDILLAREYGRIAHLKRRMLEELASGSKILVRKVDRGETEEDLRRLSEALDRHGPSPLLLVREAGPEGRPGVRQLSERVFTGSVPRFAPTETAWAVDLEPWLILCDQAYAACHRQPEPPRPAAPAPALPLRGGLRRLRADPAGPGLSAFTKAVDPHGFDPAAAFVFSAWVWIPPDCTASRIFAVTGQHRLGWRDADLAVRGRWQRVWAAGRFRPEPEPAPVGLGMMGGDGTWFWSWGARVHEGVVPGDRPPPRIVPGPAPLRWITAALSGRP